MSVVCLLNKIKISIKPSDTKEPKNCQVWVCQFCLYLYTDIPNSEIFRFLIKDISRLHNKYIFIICGMSLEFFNKK